MKRKTKIKIVVSFIIFIFAILWGYLIFSLSDMNTSNSNGKSTGFIYLFIEDTLKVTNKYEITNSHPDEKKITKASNLINSPLRKVAHATVYFILAFLLMLYISYLFDGKKILVSFIIVMLLSSGYAFTDEYHQTKVEGRTGQIKDVAIDSLGALAGTLFYGTYYIAYMIGKKSKLK